MDSGWIGMDPSLSRPSLYSGKTTDFKLIGRVVVKGEKCTSLRILEGLMRDGSGWIGILGVWDAGKFKKKHNFQENTNVFTKSREVGHAIGPHPSLHSHRGIHF